ncbi:uncharacterized protein N7511_001146 [Penicillium nucicola]|uniref:uncharacterized protein n=1 Tax=Penicillium nucicola TaxID=1850975 RepID=UPI002544E652|nr:uncharacterized protein N7511_001146 [Penicillium nucicola]KAJ5776135.1 hypothetical protein N7511_001146 [Penicillium nucicola]
MTDNGTSRHQSQRPHKKKRQPLTHFLCLPLVNASSITQLESSLTAFKASHLPGPRSSPPASSNGNASPSSLTVPSGAFRPLGTLHLTLGVMSLGSKKRLEEALSFLCSLDLKALMSEADRVATRKRNTHNSLESSVSTHVPADAQPMIVSLESLHALPSAKSATMLHASPVDPTGRLYPFCVMIRDKFIEAGFVHNENSKPSTEEIAQDKSSTDDRKVASGNKSPQVGEKPLESSITTGNMDPYTAALSRKPKPRPLLLHATLVNTVYVRGRQNTQSKGADGRKPPNRITFDARDLISQYKDYYTDETRTSALPVDSKPKDSSRSTSDVGGNSKQPGSFTQHPNSANSRQLKPTYPFVWARDITLDTVCICEMGARKIPSNPHVNSNHDLNNRLGEKYTVVGARSLGEK